MANRSFLLGAGALIVVTAGVVRCASPARGPASGPVEGVTQASGRFGGEYSGLDLRRRKLVDDWVARFNEVTGQGVKAGPFYDTYVKLSAKTTFDAVTHALMTTPLSDESGRPLGDALELVEHVESLRGEVVGASGDRQFRMYARVKDSTRDVLDRSREFKRGLDNSVYHKGYPLNYRQQGGMPSIQFSLSTDGHRADIDVDYRASSFPAALFNGHLTSANSDVRAGSNPDRHAARWTGFQNWWQSFFGIRLTRDPARDPGRDASALTAEPRLGRQSIEAMAKDFLTAWLVEGHVLAAHAYFSDRAYACLALDAEDPGSFDRGMAPFQLLIALRTAHDGIGTRGSLAEVTRGVRVSMPELKVVQQPDHARFVVYDVPDDLAVAFDCESRLQLGPPPSARRTYGRYKGTIFNVDAQRNATVALLWTRENGYWKIVSWKTDVNGDDPDAMSRPPEMEAPLIEADLAFADASRGFLESWLVRKDYDTAFSYFSQESYACYDLIRAPEEPPSSSREEAGKRLRAALQRAGDGVGTVGGLDAILTAAPPFHPAIRVMRHEHARTFSLASVPDAIAEAAQCTAQQRDFTGTAPPEYGKAFGMTVRFLTRGGDAPVLRTLWTKMNGGWRITAFGVELP